MEKNKGAAGGGERDARGSVVRPQDKTKTLSEMGVTKSMSSQAASDLSKFATLAATIARHFNFIFL
jgi:hypothetical protein